MIQVSLSKRSGASGIVSPRNLFRRARLKLTGIYIIIIALIVFGFSLFLYQSTVKNFSEASADDFVATSSQDHFVAVASNKLQDTLIFSDIVILFFVTGIGYVLAGRTLRPVEASHEAQRLFAAHASHELRTPLAIMRNDIEVLLRDPKLTPSQVRLTLSSSLEEIQKMTEMTEDLLLLARSEETYRSVASISLEKIAARVAKRMRPLAEKQGITLTFEATSPISVRGNEDMLSRVLINIIQNSVEHTPPGGSVRIVLSTAEQKNGSGTTERLALLTIADTGTGIPAADLPHVFTRFYKGTESSQQRTGLGLAIVKEIVNTHGGSVDIESEIGTGTVVTIKLPLA
jgi:two-component system sensor histidine kinase CiaH